MKQKFYKNVTRGMAFLIGIVLFITLIVLVGMWFLLPEIDPKWYAAGQIPVVPGHHARIA